MRLSAVIISFFIIQGFSLTIGQEKENWMLMNDSGSKNIELGDSSKRKVNFHSGSKGNIKIEADLRISKLIKYMGTPDNQGNLIAGYRVQIFFDNNKSITNREKSKFKTRYGNDIGCYTEYKAPNYRIKVGDFRTEIEAENFKQRLISIFPTAFVVKDKIHLPKLATKANYEN